MMMRQQSRLALGFSLSFAVPTSLWRSLLRRKCVISANFTPRRHNAFLTVFGPPMNRNLDARDRSLVLLLTATIDPGHTVMVARRDPLVRLADYQKALTYWLSTGAIRRIVFCENSNYDLTSLKNIAADSKNCDIEFISLSGNQSGATKGKGYAELEMIKYAMGTSQLLSNSEIILKCTGRLTVRNATVLVGSITSCEFDVMCALKSYLSIADSRVFAATPAFFCDHLFPKLPIVDDNAGIYFEHALARATACAIGVRSKWRPFPRFPLIEGISGTDGTLSTNSILAGVTKTLYHRFRKFVYQH
jgi:hypothetical protein